MARRGFRSGSIRSGRVGKESARSCTALRACCYRIKDIKARSGATFSTLFDLELYGSDPDQTVVLRLKRRLYEENNWRRRDTICIVGRTSLFGTIIDRTTRNTTDCN